MRAVVQRGYGSPDALELAEIDRPAIGTDEVLVRVRAASVHPDVWHVVRGRPYVLRAMGAGVRRPRQRVPGTDLAGVVEAVGTAASRLRVGDEVFGETFRGHQWRNGGAYAEYAAVPEDVLAPKPAALTFEQAAAVPTSGLLALSGVRDQGKVRPGQHVLVNGAGGGVGSFAVQLATAYGAQVTAVDAPDKPALLRSLGADRVLDFTREDFTQGSERYDVVLDVPGNRSIADCRRVVASGGRYVLIGHDGFGGSAGRWFGSLPRFLRLMAMTPFVRELPPLDFSTPDKRSGLAALNELIDAGKLTPLVDSTFGLGEVAAAIRRLETGQVRGKVVVVV